MCIEVWKWIRVSVSVNAKAKLRQNTLNIIDILHTFYFLWCPKCWLVHWNGDKIKLNILNDWNLCRFDLCVFFLQCDTIIRAMCATLQTGFFTILPDKCHIFFLSIAWCSYPSPKQLLYTSLSILRLCQKYQFFSLEI